MNKRIIYLYILLVFFITGFYLFREGEMMGVERYKYSKNFYLALKSSYMFGYWDCQEGHKPDYWGTEDAMLPFYCTNCATSSLCISYLYPANIRTRIIYDNAKNPHLVLGTISFNNVWIAAADGKECK